ncbi:MAG: hypothetical protein H0U60_02985 [Blastocatellia bacterium]|nr:hypothetical protein [Blastocatellia bacterium]
MNAKTRKLMTLAAVILALGMFSLEPTASAQSPHNNHWIGIPAASARAAQSASAQSSNSNCKQAKGNWFDTFNPTTGGTIGTITNAGVLNGTTETVYDPAFVFTPDPNVFAYIAQATFTTNQGLLKTNNVYIYNFVTGLWIAMGSIDPNASTGRFAGATGVLYFNGTTVGGFPESYPAGISGDICFAN